MTSGVDELEAFIAALRLSFITSSSTAGSPESLRQGIEAFREALGRRSTSTTTPSPTEEFAEKRDSDHHSGPSGFAQAEDHISSASTVWSCDDKPGIDALTKQIELISSEVREGTSQIRELIQTVKELKTEVRDLRSTVSVSPAVSSSEVHLSSPAPIRPALQASAGSALIREVQGESLVVSTPSPPITLRSFTPPNPLPVAEPPGSRPELPQTAAPVTLTCSSETSHPVFINVPAIVAQEAEDPKPTLSRNKPQDSTFPRVASSEGKNKVTTAKESEACDPIHEDIVEGQDVKGPNSKDAGLHPESPVIATAISYCSNSWSEEELEFRPGDQITILNSPNTPVGWMYGERVNLARRGIFLDRYVREMSDPEVKRLLSVYPSISENFSATEPSAGSKTIRVAIHFSNGSSKGELDIRAGDRITILESQDTPDGWMYGEIVEKRRGIFPVFPFRD
ncbi:hypothetical protein FRC00_002181 [Tulasnella sp. 408]|nr:hypothetical protein FRC00_002181 [Tulasnella sp. 408]